MIDFLADARRKRARAETHFKAIEQVVKQFTEREPDLVPGKLDRGRSEYVFEWPRPLPEPGLAEAVGDCVYNLRATLDYLITALVRSAGNEEDYSTEFPIYDVPIDTVPYTAVRSKWETGDRGIIARKLRGTPPTTKALIEKLQPFDGVPGVDPDEHPLAILKALSNRDKHRRLNVVASRIDVTLTNARGEPLFNQPAPHGTVSIPEGSESDTQIVTVSLAPGSPGTEVEMHLRPVYDIAFEEDRPLLDWSVIDTLTSIREFIDGRVVPVIESLLPPPGQ